MHTGSYIFLKRNFYSHNKDMIEKILSTFLPKYSDGFFRVLLCFMKVPVYHNIECKCAVSVKACTVYRSETMDNGWSAATRTCACVSIVREPAAPALPAGTAPAAATRYTPNELSFKLCYI